MQLFLNDAEGRKYEIDVETEKWEDTSFTSSARRTEVTYEHKVTVRPAIDEFYVTSTDESDPTQLFNRIFALAQKNIEEWLENK